MTLNNENSHLEDGKQSEIELPKFAANVIPVDKITRTDLVTLLALYRDGEIQPMILGESNTPEAAIIPFAAFVRLLRYDHAASSAEEEVFLSELRRRVQDLDERRADGEAPTTMNLDELAASLGGPAAEMIRDQTRDE